MAEEGGGATITRTNEYESKEEEEEEKEATSEKEKGKEKEKKVGMMSPWEQHSAVINLPRFDYNAPSSLLHHSHSGFLITCTISQLHSSLFHPSLFSH